MKKYLVFFMVVLSIMFTGCARANGNKKIDTIVDTVETEAEAETVNFTEVLPYIQDALPNCEVSSLHDFGYKITYYLSNATVEDLKTYMAVVRDYGFTDVDIQRMEGKFNQVIIYDENHEFKLYMMLDTDEGSLNITCTQLD